MPAWIYPTLEIGAPRAYLRRMKTADVLTLSPAGLYCPLGDFHIDPTRPSPRALITHGHADHARAGHGAVMATRETLDIMALRYGEGFTRSRQVAEPGRATRVGEVDVTFHPAGHVLGSAQILIEAKGFRVVVSGDYKRARDPTCAPFEPVRCDAFITEATFGLPVFRHPEASTEVERLISSIKLFPDRAHVIGVYSLGKAQRVMALIREAGWDRPFHIHGALEKISRYYADAGARLGEFTKVATAEKPGLAGEIALCPPSAIADRWSAGFADPVRALASGWMRIRAFARRGSAQLPLVISDHADWDALRDTVVETGCSELWVTHGATEPLTHWARARGLDAKPLDMVGYGDEEAAVEEAAP